MIATRAMELTIIAPPPTLAGLILHILVIDTDGGASTLPAGLATSLVFSARGGVLAEDGARRCPRCYFHRPSMLPRRGQFEGHTVSISVAFRPGMLRQAIGIDSGELAADMVPAEELVAPPLVRALYEGVDSANDRAAYVAQFQRFLLAALDPGRASGMGALFYAARQKMFMPLVDMAGLFGVGQRQLERRIRTTFGVSLRDLRRVARFGLTLPLIVGQGPARGDLTRIAHDAGYYDQAHMHREFVELCGHAPSELLQKIAGDDPAYWVYRLGEEDFRKLFIP